MQVVRLEIFGFKSFMDRLVLPLDQGLTGVVGPNGCGKSNIVDAVRWVLGESRATRIRGSTLEDVIFNGTEKVRPLGLAEVTVTLRASSDNFFEDILSEQSHSSEFELSTAMSEVDSALAVHKASQSDSDSSGDEKPKADVQSDNEVSDAITDKGRPRLRVIDGRLGDADSRAADVEGAGSREDDAVEQPGLDNQTSEQTKGSTAVKAQVNPAETSLTQRFAWLGSTNEVQVTRRYYRSGESEYYINRVPCRLKDISELFNAVGLGPRAFTIVAQDQVSRIVTAKPEQRRLILEEAAGVQGFRDKIGAANRRLSETATNVSRLDDIIREVQRQVSSLKRQAAKARNREALRTQICQNEESLFGDSFVRLQERLMSAGGEMERLGDVEARLQAELQRVHAEEQEARSELMRIDVEGDAVRSSMDAIRQELANREQQRSSRKARLGELNALVTAREAEIERQQARVEELAKRVSHSQSVIANLEEQDRDLVSSIQSIESHGEQRLIEISSQLNAARDEVREHEKQIRSVRDGLIAARSRLESSREQLDHASPIAQVEESVRSELLNSDGALPLFVDGVSCPEKYTTALQAILRERASFVVADRPQEVAEVFERASSDDNGLSAVGVLRSGPAIADGSEAQLEAVLQHAPCRVERLVDQLQIEASHNLAATALLGKVYVVDNTADAYRVFNFLQERASQVVHSLTLVTFGGAVVTAYSYSRLKTEGGLVDLKARVEKLRLEERRLESHSNELLERRAELQYKVTELEQAHAEALSESQVRAEEVRALSAEQGNIRGRLQTEERSHEQLRRDADNLGQQIVDAKRTVAELQEERSNVATELERLAGEDEGELTAELERLSQTGSAIEEQRRTGRSKLGELAENVDQARSKLDGARAEVTQSTLEHQKVVLEQQNLEERMRESLGDGFITRVRSMPEDELLLEREVRAELQDEVDRLRARVKREGDVDPTSIVRCEEESERLADLVAQREDLESAANTLSRTIAKLTEVSKQRFLETFHAVNENFDKLIPRLFGGGHGHLDLSDPNNPLDSGVEIIARPPGKKLKNIDMLSGGEKALCATALVFAMFLERPSPLCVLDEVDAPLDDANVVRFANLIREMSTKTQFLVITHNKQTMRAADHLCGVTMQQPGISTVLSVSLDEAYQQVA